jgi:hypothetical protein
MVLSCENVDLEDRSGTEVPHPITRGTVEHEVVLHAR